MAVSKVSNFLSQQTTSSEHVRQFHKSVTKLRMLTPREATTTWKVKVFLPGSLRSVIIFHRLFISLATFLCPSPGWVWLIFRRHLQSTSYIAPENRPSQKENHHPFSDAMLVSRRVTTFTTTPHVPLALLLKHLAVNVGNEAQRNCFSTIPAKQPRYFGWKNAMNMLFAGCEICMIFIELKFQVAKFRLQQSWHMACDGLATHKSLSCYSKYTRLFILKSFRQCTWMIYISALARLNLHSLWYWQLSAK